MSESLKPCPCGGSPSIAFAFGGYDCAFVAKCRACGRAGEAVPATIVEVMAFGDWYFDDHRRKAAAAWNEALAGGGEG